jgi:pseudoazurin
MKRALTRIGVCLALLLTGIAAPAMAETHIVKLMSYDPDGGTDMVDYFDPPLIQIAKGDTVLFEATQLGHNAAFKKGMLPEGAPEWVGPMDKDYEVTFDVDGTYGYICSPHYSTGMVGIVLVGDYKVNMAEAKKAKQRGKAKKIFRALFKEVEALE